MDSKRRSLILGLTHGPRFLLLGQNLGLDRSTAPPPLPSEAEPGTDLAEEFAAYSDRMLSDAPSEQLLRLAGYSWNGVFTSRIDAALPHLFEAPWRRVAATGGAQLGRFPRSATELIVRMLFGGVELVPDERPPTNAIQESDTRTRARDTLFTFATKLITPRGIVLIECFGRQDWLSTEEMYSLLTRLQPGQAHLFSMTPELARDQFIDEAVRRGQLITHSSSAAEALDELSHSGVLNFRYESADSSGTRLIPVKNGFAKIGVDIWNQVIGSVRPIDTELLEPSPMGPDPTEYQRLLELLGSSEGMPPWKSIASGMKITRDFEEELLRRVRKGLSEPNPKPLILMGQTATGKSMALCQLAIEIARAGQFAVLHQSRRGERPNLSDIDRFCAWAEENSLPAVLLIWDGMESPDEYYGLNNDLRARGRRVQIVGSSYKLRRRPKSEIISASPDLSEAEITEMKAWLRRFKIPTPELSDHELESSLLALLYRALPQTERGLRRGLSMEMRASEFGLEKQARSLDRTEVGCYGAVAHALLVAGYEIKVFVPSDHPDEEMKSLHFDQRSTAEQLTAVVLVAGRRGLPVPLELLLRIIGRAGVNQIVDLVTSFDIFRWTEDENSGEQYIGSRTQLEAELLARENITLESEVEILAQYITEIHADSTLWGGREVEFIVDLIGRIGPQAAGLNNSSEYSRYYGALADSLRDRRERGAPGHPRLVLLEANLRREYVVKNKRDLPKFDERLRILEYSRCLLEATAYEDNVGKRTRLFLLVELASTVGAEIYELTANSVQPDRVMNLMERVVEISLEARALDPENVYPVDVVAWVSDNLVRKSNLTPVDRVRVLADADASLDSFDSELLNPGQRANYLQRRANIASLMQDQARESNYLDVLRQSGDPAAYYCLARYEADTGAAGLAAAVERLMTAPAAVRDDWRCSHLLFDLFWRLKAGTPFLSNERIALPFSRADWEECLKITDLITRPARYVRYKVDFLRGISLFHLGNFAISDEVFKSVERQSTDMSRRVLSSYVVSNPDGTAREFTGRVTWAAADGRRGAVWVDQLSVEVNFIPLRFSVSELRKRGDLLPKFHIAFNMRGTIADPIRGSSTRPETRSVK